MRAIPLPESFTELIAKEESTLQLIERLCALHDKQILAGEEDADIDNIIVTGEKSVGELRRDLFKAEAEFYSLYNKLNDDNDYDVRCRMESVTGNRTKHQVCRPVFFSEARNRRENLNRAIDPATDPTLQTKLATLQEKVETLVASNPDLMVAMNNFNTARARLAAN